MVHKKKDGSYIHEDAWTIAEAIQEIKGCDRSSKKLSQNDSLAQINNHGTQQTSSTSHVDVDGYQKEIVELKVEAAEEKRKKQTMENLVRYLIH
ncbi:hypothetical protein PIB30_021604 [Stylosanthes scabra]|uniref:Uncharacterized protein n=1 Tax=Stylosanthes scabra TaxID=79078 RepID=A0ABU6V7V9_9FABA|nr:hypothetical protein [Stylosanthes scabra]